MKKTKLLNNTKKRIIKIHLENSSLSLISSIFGIARSTANTTIKVYNYLDRTDSLAKGGSKRVSLGKKN